MTALEVFEIVDPINYDLFLKEVEKQNNLGKLANCAYRNIYYLIDNCLSWDRTVLGFNYWKDVADSLLNIDIENFINCKYYI